MSAFSDLLHGNFSNIGHDLAADPVGTGIGALGLTALTAGLAAPALFGGEAALLGAGAAEGAGAGFLGFGGEAAGAGLSGAEGVSTLLGEAGTDTLLGGAGADTLSGLTAEGIQAESLGPLADQGAQGAAGGGESFIDKLLGAGKKGAGAIGDQIMKNPIGIGAAGLGAALNFRNANQTSPNQQKLQGQADQLSAQGQQFMQFLQSGTLPPGLQAAVDKAKEAHKATLISNAARNGLSTDPNQNTALAQDLAAADRDALIAVAKEGEVLFKAGADEVGLSNQIYSKLIQLDQEKSNRMGTAIANFARSLNGGLSMSNKNG